jgi:hypothetical protein
MRHPPCFAERAWYLYENHCVPLARVPGAAFAEVLQNQKNKKALKSGGCAPGFPFVVQRKKGLPQRGSPLIVDETRGALPHTPLKGLF